MNLFSQTAYALTIPEFTESARENLLLYGTDLGLVMDTQCTSTPEDPPTCLRERSLLHLTSIWVFIYGYLEPGQGDRTTHWYGNLFPAAGLYLVENYLR